MKWALRIYKLLVRYNYLLLCYTISLIKKHLLFGGGTGSIAIEYEIEAKKKTIKSECEAGLYPIAEQMSI